MIFFDDFCLNVAKNNVDSYVNCRNFANETIKAVFLFFYKTKFY